MYGKQIARLIDAEQGMQAFELIQSLPDDIKKDIYNELARNEEKGDIGISYITDLISQVYDDIVFNNRSSYKKSDHRRIAQIFFKILTETKYPNENIRLGDMGTFLILFGVNIDAISKEELDYFKNIPIKTDYIAPSGLSWESIFDDIADNKGTTNMENNEIDKIVREELQAYMLEKKKKKACKPSKGKRFAKRVDGKCRSFGQKGQAKRGGDRIRPGTKKGDAYCARSAKIKKCKNPPCANDLSRKKWKCRGSKSVA